MFVPAVFMMMPAGAALTVLMVMFVSIVLVLIMRMPVMFMMMPAGAALTVLMVISVPIMLVLIMRVSVMSVPVFMMVPAGTGFAMFVMMFLLFVAVGRFFLPLPMRFLS